MKLHQLLEQELSKKLQDWKENVEFHMQKTDQDAHDALVDMQEQDLHPLTNEEAEILMRAMGDVWNNQ